MGSRYNFCCPVCSGTEYIVRQGHARDNSSLHPLECSQCGCVTLSSMEQITEDFYADGHMHDSKPCDPLLMLEQEKEDSQRRFVQFGDSIRGKNILDVGCGAGGFLLKAKDLAKTVAGVEPEKQLRTFHKEHGLTVYQDVADVPAGFRPDVITLFHVLEHIPAQVHFLKSLKHLFLRERERERERES